MLSINVMAVTFTITTTEVTTRLSTMVAIVVEAAWAALSALCQIVLDVTRMVYSIFLYGLSRTASILNY